MRLHFLALGDTGWGEVTLALRIALDARAHGHDCSFTVPESLLGHVRSCGFEASVDSRAVGADFLDHTARQCEGADLRILVDLNLFGAALLGRQVHPEAIFEGSPLVGIDTWHYRELGSHIDLAPGVELPIEPLWRDLPRRIVPVPFVRPGAAGACDLLPPARSFAASPRKNARPQVLICTSWWQHALLDQPQGLPVAELIGLYLDRLGVDIHHIGPADLPWRACLGSRYRRSGSLPIPAFEAAVAEADLVLSLNASATTNTTALRVGTPVMTVWNRWSARSGALQFKLGYPPSRELRGWLARHAPVPHFAMWPMSWERVLSTLLAGNPYAELLHLTDLLDERSFHDTATRLLEDSEAIEAERTRREAYLIELRALPGPSDLLEQFGP